MTSSGPMPNAQVDDVRRTLVRNRMLAVLVLFFVALAGGVCAVALDRLVMRPGPAGHRWFAYGSPARGPGEREHPFHFRERFSVELGLSHGQQTRIDSLMDRQLSELRAVHARVQPQIDSIVGETRREIDAILTPEQRAKAQTLVPQ